MLKICGSSDNMTELSECDVCDVWSRNTTWNYWNHGSHKNGLNAYKEIEILKVNPLWKGGMWMVWFSH